MGVVWRPSGATGTCNRFPARVSCCKRTGARMRTLESQAVTWRGLLARVQARVTRPRGQIVSGRDLGEVVEIGRLACPLRYDLWVRIDFIRLLRREWHLYQSNIPEFLGRPESQAYFIWFRDVASARFQPELTRDQTRLRPAFLDRVHDTARLWQSIQSDGYDPATPIQLRAGRKVQPVNGKLVESSYFAGDGCHRMACLFVSGQTSLTPEQYEVKIQDSFHPLDNTAVLIRQLPLTRARYLRFISGFYCRGEELNTAEAIVTHVASNAPHLLAELESVLDFDLPSFSDQ
jgi:hypothetical protein